MTDADLSEYQTWYLEDLLIDADYAVLACTENDIDALQGHSREEWLNIQTRLLDELYQRRDSRFFKAR